MGRRVRSRPIRRLTIYHFELAIEAGCNAYAAPLGFLEAGARDFTGEIPLILKTNDNDVLREEEDPNQALTESARPAHVRHAQPSDGLAIWAGRATRVCRGPVEQLGGYQELGWRCRK
jgi:fructose-bisphosphate aldolase, class I